MPGTPRTYGDYVLLSLLSLSLILILIPNLNAYTGTATWAQTDLDAPPLRLPAGPGVDRI
jgi:hypothetical protein